MSHYEDEAEVEQLRRWWRENWMALAGGLGIGLAGIFGWETWQDARTAQSEKASQIYEDLRKVTPDRSDQAAALGHTLIEDYAGTPYAAQGALYLAAKAVERSDWDAARTRLEWAARHADDPGLKKIARLRLARVLWQQQKTDEALAQLEIKDDDAFASLYQELRGDIELGRGDRDKARAAYEKAMALGPAPANRELLQRKLDDLGAETAQAQS